MNREHQQLFPVIRQIDFPNGHRIDVHMIEDGKVCYQVWPCGVEQQSVFANLRRMTVDAFEAAIMEHGGVEVSREDSSQ